MNIFIGILCTIISTFLGYYFAEKYILRKKFYNDFYYFNKNLYNQISFNKKTIIDIIQEKKENSYFNNVLKSYFIEKNFLLNKHFTVDENEFVLEYLSNIGASDYNTQKKYITEIEGLIKEKKQLSEVEEKKYKKVYIKLGFTIGVIIFIILL